MYKQIYTEKPFDFTKHSTIGCGGLAQTAYYPCNETETLALLTALREEWVVVGNLSNILPPDEGIKQAVICTKRLTDIFPVSGGIFVSAGVTSGALLRYMQATGFSGAEFLAGIPCTLGGILYMNGGVSGKYIAEIVENVCIIRDGKVLNLPVQECGYSYKNSVFMQTMDFILGATLRLENKGKETVKEEMKRWLNKRAYLPKGRSMGCVFKNPSNLSAGALIDGAGLKGRRIGGAKVSEIHANFIINDKNATAEDIRALIQVIKDAVYKQYGVMLEEEIKYL